jgi:H+/Cl- antiporter ClcA/CBS domain-containing protein
MEAVLFGQSRMRFRVGILKPLATAFAIGTGGPFGEEGPIIQTGAAFGSIFGQAINLTPYQRRILLAAGAAAGMAATFKAPLAGLMVAVELLLFEMRARSFIPVAFAAASATAVRVYFAGWAPLFPTPPFQLRHMQELWLFALLGVLMGVVGLLMIRALFWLEDLFDHLPAKRALLWSPAIGALILGIIGYFYPEVFGTGYDTIHAMLNDQLTVGKLLGVSVAKFWALTISLGSGTTGGVFAPSLIIGGGIGAAYAAAWHHFLPQYISDPAFYSLIAMAAAFGGIARAPFTSIVFLFELSRNPNSLLPLIVCVMMADGFVRLFSRESIMTGKLVKRGLIVLQDYSVPVLMRARISQVMHKQFSTIPAEAELRAVVLEMAPKAANLLPVVTEDGALVGILEAHDLLQVESPDHHFKAREVARQDYVLAYPEEPVDKVSREMLTKNVENVIVVEHGAKLKPVGIARAADILRLRRWLMEEEGSAKGAFESADET